ERSEPMDVEDSPLPSPYIRKELISVTVEEPRLQGSISLPVSPAEYHEYSNMLSEDIDNLISDVLYH
ncbi:hypothetical protein DKP78_15630, partial [Enterococcus faecium]